MKKDSSNVLIQYLKYQLLRFNYNYYRFYFLDCFFNKFYKSLYKSLSQLIKAFNLKNLSIV